MVSKRFMELVEEVKDLHTRKNAGYSGIDNVQKRLWNLQNN